MLGLATRLVIAERVLDVLSEVDPENVQSVVPALRTLTNALISSSEYEHGHGR